jgi:hypothetical protein
MEAIEKERRDRVMSQKEVEVTRFDERATAGRCDLA